MRLHQKGKEKKLREYQKAIALYEQGFSFEEIGKLNNKTRSWAEKVIRNKMRCQQEGVIHN